MIGFDFEGMIVLHVHSSHLCVNNNLPHMFVCFVKLQIKDFLHSKNKADILGFPYAV